jgi:serine/threonine protein kinase
LGKITQHKRNRSHFSEEELWSISLQLFRGLKKLHSMQILHRDIKGANVFVCKDGTVKIGDLNVSKVNKKGLAHTQTGTPYYTSPEVWKDQPYDSKCDIWSVGCVLYEAAALSPPFTASSMEELYRKVIRGVYPPLPSLYSEGLQGVIRSMLQVRPEMRPSVVQLLQMPSVLSHDSQARNLEATVQGGLIGTIALPRNLSQLSSRLPAPKYMRRDDVPSTRASEPALHIPKPPPPLQRAMSHLSPDLQNRRLRAVGLDVVAPKPPSQSRPRVPLNPIYRENVPSRASYLPQLVQKVEVPKVISYAKQAQGCNISRIQALQAQYARNDQRIYRPPPPRPVVPKWWG